MDNTCCIFGAGEYDGAPLPTGQPLFLIAADGGYEHLARLGLTPQLLVGDCDSVQSIPTGVELVRHPVRKDDTDLALALAEGQRRGMTTFLIYGGLGGRLDHTMANLQLLTGLSLQGCRGFLLSRHTAVTALTGGTLTFDPRYRGTLSLFSAGDRAEGITLTGLDYPLVNGTLTHHTPRGVSNTFLGVPASIRVQLGTLLVFWANQPHLPLPTLT